MLRIVTCISACLLLATLTAAAAQKPAQDAAVAGPVRLNAQAPDFKLTNFKGEARTLSQYRGKVVMLNFWASWCPYCREEMPSMDRLNKLFPKGEVVILAVNVEKQIPDKYRRSSISFEILCDSREQVQQMYGATRLPVTFIIDRKGTVVKQVPGAFTWDDPKVVAYLKSLSGS